MIEDSYQKAMRIANEEAAQAERVANAKRREQLLEGVTITDWLEHPGAEIFLSYLQELSKNLRSIDILGLDLSGDNQHVVLQLLGRRMKAEIIEKHILGYFAKQKSKAHQLLKEETRDE